MPTIKIVIFEDNDDLREALAELVKSEAGYECVGTFFNCEGVESIVKETLPDIILMDIEMPAINGLEGIRRIRAMNTSVKIIVLTVFEDNGNVFEAIRSGASGYLLKKSSPDKIIGAIRDAMEGGAPMTGEIARKVLDMLGKGQLPLSNESMLSPREKEILTLLVNGHSYKMIAANLGIGFETVKSHLKKIYEKLQVHSQAEAVSKALRNRIV